MLTLSSTAISQILEELGGCPKMYWYKNYSGANPDWQDKSAAIFGTTIHSIFEKFYYFNTLYEDIGRDEAIGKCKFIGYKLEDVKWWDPILLQRLSNDIFVENFYDGSDIRKECTKEKVDYYYRILNDVLYGFYTQLKNNNLLETGLTQEIKLYSVYAYKGHKILLTGVIDNIVIIRWNGNITIMDYKTGRITQEDADKSHQLTLYDDLVHQSLHMSADKCCLVTKDNVFFTTQNQEKFDKLFGYIDKAVECIIEGKRNGKWPEAKKCNQYCEYRGACGRQNVDLGW